MNYILIYLIVINIVAFILMFLDKKFAENHAWRISEKTLIMSAYLGGFIGYIAGMEILRHKTKHSYFYLNFYISLVLWLVIGFLLFKKII